VEEGQAYQKIAELLAATQNTVVVTGAGISTEAGIPDFRGEKGIYRTLGEDKVLSLLNINTFRKKPGNFYDFYRNYFMMPQVKPSRAHCLLAEMEKNAGTLLLRLFCRILRLCLALSILLLSLVDFQVHTFHMQESFEFFCVCLMLADMPFDRQLIFCIQASFLLLTTNH
jgi:hypothetical protein